MVHHVFGRVVRPDPRSATAAGSRRDTMSENEARRLEAANAAAQHDAPSVPTTPAADGEPKMTL